MLGLSRRSPASVLHSSALLRLWSGGEKDLLRNPKEKIARVTLVQDTCNDFALIGQRFGAVTFAESSLQILTGSDLFSSGTFGLASVFKTLSVKCLELESRRGGRLDRRAFNLGGSLK